MKPPAGGGAWDEHRALFADDTVLQLTEHLQPSALIPAISTGCTLSMLHARGLLHGDLHGNNTLFDAQTGVAGLVDVEDLSTTELSTERMATDFLVPLASMGFPWCQALLAGYIKVARLSIDPKHPGYCDDLLDMLGGSIDSDPRPRAATLPLETLTDSLGWLSSNLQAERDPAVFWASPTTPAQCAYIIGGLIASGADCSVLSASPSAGFRTSDHAAIRDMLASASPGQAPGACPAGVPPVGWDFIAMSLAAKARQQAASRVKPNTDIFRTIAELRKTHPQEDLEEMLCSFTEVCDWLATRADGGMSHFPKDLTIQSAQVTYMLLQLVSEPALAESAELAAAGRHAALSWYRGIVDHRVQIDDRDLLYLFAYTNSRVSAYRQLFQGEEGSLEGRQWTADWRAAAMGREWLRRLLARRMTPGHEPYESASLLDQAISMATNNLGATLNDYLQQVLLALATHYLTMTEQQRQNSGFKALEEEIGALIQLLEVARSRDPGSALTSEYLEYGTGYLKRYSRLSTLPFDTEIGR